MIDAHFHRAVYDTYLSREEGEVRFFGCHPWQVGQVATEEMARIEAALLDNPQAGVGEIGLDRLHKPDAAAFSRQRAVFVHHLELAARLNRPVVLHGAKCWGEVVKACLPYKGRIPAFLFHGFSRSGGLVPEIIALNGFISVGPAVANDHAVNYRELVATLPPDRVLVETDVAEDDPETDRIALLDQVYGKFAELRGLSVPELAAEVAANAARFLSALA
ncbi:MAG: TatD family hydrolase [Kiritimatiellae bacterium]|nr:TatD family hydrolase [Kiritimatiellia bacterium]